MTDTTPEGNVPAIALVGLEEVAESVTGFDEIAIDKQFGTSLYEMKALAPRALLFVHLRRHDLPDATAYRTVMEMTLKSVMSHFETDDEVMPEEPVTDAGKDDCAPAQPPTS